MLMPILTVKTRVALTQAAAVVESVRLQQQASVLPDRISGNQSEAVLKILETLNRHLVGSEPLPKEALIRLLDTLAKLLKFPPLPQETLRDFSKRLAVFLETLPPAARLALENQLGSRNLAVSMRILAEALKTPSLADVPRLLERIIPAPTFRPTAIPPDVRPAPSSVPVQQGEPNLPVRQAPLPAGQLLLTNPAVIPDPGFLQAALKKAFGDEDDGAAATIVAEENENEQGSMTASRRGSQVAQLPAARNGDSAATTAQTRPSAGTSADTIPLLRAAVAFLAADADALSQVAAIVAGDIDSRIKVDPGQETWLDMSSETGAPAERNPVSQPETLAAAGEDTGTLSAADMPFVERDLPRLLDAQLAEHLAAGPKTRAGPMGEVEGFTGHDLGEWELEAQPDTRSVVSMQEAQPASSEPKPAPPEKALAQTLKALVEASLPLPGKIGDAASGTLFASLAGEAADMGAQALFAELEAADVLGVLPDGDIFTTDTGDQTGPPAFKDDAWINLLDRPEEKVASRQTALHHSAMDDGARELPVPRNFEMGFPRDAIPFAMIPYLPAKTQETRFTFVEEEQRFSGDEGQGEREDGGDQPQDHDGDDTASAQAEQAKVEEDERDADLAYDLYRRMGELG